MTPCNEDLVTFSENICEVLTTVCDRRSVHAYFDGGNDLDLTLWDRATELGWLGIGVSEEFGGLGLGPRGLDVLFRSLGQNVSPGPFCSTLVGAQWLSECTALDVAKQFVSAVVAGTLSLGIPVAPGGVSMKMQGGRITGESETLLIHPRTRLSILPVNNEGEAGFALVPVGAGDADLARIELWDRTNSIGRVKCRNVAPAAVIPDPRGRAVDLLRCYLALAVASDSVGGARAIADQTVAYLKLREQFGRPLASLQALKHRAADLYVAIVKAEQVLECAIDAADGDVASAGMWAALAKAAASEAYLSVADDCMQLHGGVGFTWEFDCHIYLKRALLNRQLAGDNRALRDLAAGQLTEATLAGITTAEFAA